MFIMVYNQHHCDNQRGKEAVGRCQAVVVSNDGLLIWLLSRLSTAVKMKALAKQRIHMMKVGPVQTGECGERVFNGGIHYDYYNADCQLEEKKRDQARINTLIHIKCLMHVHV